MVRINYVEPSPDGDGIALLLPENLETYRDELKNDLLYEYAFEGINKSTIEKMNDFVVRWFAGRGISLPAEEK